MKKWKQNVTNEICYLDNKKHYISINNSVNETALRLFIDKDNDYSTFIVMGNHKAVIDNLSSDFEILDWFERNINGDWSDSTQILRNYITDSFGDNITTTTLNHTLNYTEE